MTPKIIVSAFKKASMWPPNIQVVLQRMKKYSDPIEPLPPLITDKNVFSTLKTVSVVTRITCTAHMTYASRAYILTALQQRTEESIIHQSITHTYRNAVIFVPVD